MHFALPTPGLDLPCAVPNFMAIPAVTANPHTRLSRDLVESDLFVSHVGVSNISYQLSCFQSYVYAVVECINYHNFVITINFTTIMSV